MERWRRLSGDCSSVAASGALSAAVKETQPCLRGNLTPTLVKSGSLVSSTTEEAPPALEDQSVQR